MRRRPHRRRRVRRAHRRGQARKPSRWRWLGLGALAVAGFTLLRRERRSPVPEKASRGSAVPEPAVDVDRCWIAGPAGTLRVLERHPDGELAIVFIHGLGGRAEHWMAQFHAAGPAIRAVAFDLPGHGGSDRAANGDYSVPAAAAAIGAVLDALGLRRAVLVAHSLGTAAAIEYAGRHPERVTGLLLVDPSGDQSRMPEADRRELLAQLSRDPGEEISWYFRQLLAGDRAELASRVLEDLSAVPTEVVLSAIEGGLSYRPLSALSRFGGPVTSIISDLNDLPYGLHNLVPDLPVRRVPRASHWLMLDRPADLWTWVIEFLEELQTPGQKSYRSI